MTRHICSILMLGFTLAVAPLAAQEATDVPAPDPAQRDRIELVDGKVKFGTVLSYDFKARTLKVQVEDGELLTLRQRDLHAKTVYRLSASRAPADDSVLQLETANYARDIGLWKHSSRHYRMALLAAESPEQAKEIYAQVEVLGQKTAAAMLDEAKRDLKRKRTKPALDTIEWMLQHLPDQPATIEAGALYAKVLEDRASKRRGVRARRNEASLNRTLASSEKDFDKMVEENRDGLLSGSKRNNAERHFKFAASYGERALKRLDKLVDDEDKAVVNAAAELREETVHQLTGTLVNLGNHYFTFGKYKDAISVCGMALAFDLDQADAKDLRTRAQEAQRERELQDLQWLYWRHGLLNPGLHWQ